MTLPAASEARNVTAGKVYLVGAGPGDPELLTLKAARLIAAADTIVYDHLIGKGILALARPDVELIYAGKKASNHTLPQEDINQLLVRLAQEKKVVIRLKGGDPFIFGRGGEEIEELAQAAIPFEIVPGITAAAGCAAYGGFPLTHRDHAQVLIFATGHLKNGTVDLDWPALARPKQTVVFYMGIGGAKAITEQMMAHGLPGHTPAAVIENGTTSAQRTIVADLAALTAAIEREKVASPALIIVGSVVTLHDTLSWFAAKH